MAGSPEEQRRSGDAETSAQPGLSPLVRALDPSDLDDLIQIEEASYPWPWTRGTR